MFFFWIFFFPVVSVFRGRAKVMLVQLTIVAGSSTNTHSKAGKQLRVGNQLLHSLMFVTLCERQLIGLFFFVVASERSEWRAACQAK